MITALNASLTETDQLILTNRTREYDTAIAEAHRVLTAAAVIEPEPLTPSQAADYLATCLTLMDFLDDAYRLGLLRTTGPAYQFRHAEFHDHLSRTGGSRTGAPTGEANAL